MSGTKSQKQQQQHATSENYFDSRVRINAHSRYSKRGGNGKDKGTKRVGGGLGGEMLLVQAIEKEFKQQSQLQFR